MIAHIWLFRRLARRVSHFDYTIPEDASIAVGDLVTVPFRNKSVLGVVSAIHKTSPFKRLKSITNLVHPTFLSPAEITVLRTISQDLLQSPSSLLHTLIPTPPKRQSTSSTEDALPVTPSISREDQARVQSIVQELKQRSEGFIQLPSLELSAAVIVGYRKTHPTTPINVVCPTVDIAKHLYSQLGFLHPELVTGEDTNNRRFRAWRTFRQSKTRILIGTGLSLFLSHPTPSTLFLIQSGHKNHKQFDRNPRYDTRLCADLMAQHRGSSQFFIDVFPRVDDHHRFSHLLLDRVRPSPIKFVPQTKKDTSGGWLATQTRTVIEHTLSQGQRVLCVFNNTEYLPSFTQSLRDQFPKQRIQLISADHPSLSVDAHLVVTTNYLLEHQFRRMDRIGLVVNTSSDLGLASEDMRATETALIELHRWWGFARRTNAKYLVQTKHTDLFNTWIQRPNERLQHALTARRTYGQFPLRRWIRLRLQPEQAKHSTSLESIIGPIQAAHPELFWIGPINNGNKHLVEIGIPLEQTDTLLAILGQLPDNVIIDPHAFSC